jgi:predicted DNA-binding transcriptional regulator AlpA
MTDNVIYKVMRTAQAAEHVGLSASTLEKLRVFGGGPRFIKLGKTVVYDTADLDAWLAAHRRASTSVAAG